MESARTGRDGQPGPGSESPEEHLERLVARAGRPLRLDEEVLHGLRTALAHWTEPQAMLGRRGPSRALRCRLLKHTYLLADGGSVVLWELEHNTGPDARMLCEVYADRGAMAEAERRVGRFFGGVRFLAQAPDRARGPEIPDRNSGPEPGAVPFDDRGLDLDFSLDTGRDPVLDPAPAPDPDWGWDTCPGTGPVPDHGHGPGVQHGEPGEADAAELWPWTAYPAVPRPGRLAYTQDHSVEHARRVLRRSENEDRPGEEALRLLDSALAHDTVFVTRRHGHVGDRFVEWSLFQHAFLLAGGAEVSLWELEHNLAPDGRLVCEVYLGEEAARASIQRRGPGL